jgi:hypothetical protein
MFVCFLQGDAIEGDRMSDGDTEKVNRLINTHIQWHSQFSGEATTEWLRLLSAYSDPTRHQDERYMCKAEPCA